MTNGDAKVRMAEAALLGQVAVGDVLHLPEGAGGQSFTVTGFGKDRRGAETVELVGPCAVEGCAGTVETALKLAAATDLRARGVARCCPEHWGFDFPGRSTARNRTSAELADRQARVAAAEQERRALQRESMAREGFVFGGPNVDAVLAARDALALVGDFSEEDLVSAAVLLLPPRTDGRRDTRRQQVVRALRRMLDAGWSYQEESSYEI